MIGLTAKAGTILVNQDARSPNPTHVAVDPREVFGRFFLLATPVTSACSWSAPPPTFIRSSTGNNSQRQRRHIRCRTLVVGFPRPIGWDPANLQGVDPSSLLGQLSVVSRTEGSSGQRRSSGAVRSARAHVLGVRFNGRCKQRTAGSQGFTCFTALSRF